MPGAEALSLTSVGGHNDGVVRLRVRGLDLAVEESYLSVMYASFPPRGRSTPLAAHFSLTTNSVLNDVVDVLAVDLLADNASDTDEVLSCLGQRGNNTNKDRSNAP